MAISDISIANRALDLAGLDPITSLSDASVSAALVARNIELDRDAALRAYPWNCAMRRAALAADTAAPDWGYAKQYALPAGPGEPRPYCLRVWSIEGERDLGAKYRIEGRLILTDEAAPLNIAYIGRPPEWASLDPLCAEAIAARLALVIASNRVRSATIIGQLRDYYRDILLEARKVDAQEGSPEEFGPEFPATTGWLESRL